LCLSGRINTTFGLDVDMMGLDHDKPAAQFIGNLLPKLHGEPNEEFHVAWRRSIRAAASEWGLRNFIERVDKYRKYFNYREILREPNVMLTPTPRIPGTDGRKMSKSYNNFISLSESDGSIRSKVRAMVTDPARKRRQDPGNPDVCPVFDWHKLFPEMQTPEKRARIDRVSLECRTAAIGCVECKGLMADALIEWIAPVRARREQYAANPGEVLELLDRGSEKARGVARNTIARVRESVFGWEKLRASLAPSGEATGAPNAPSGVTGAGSTWSPRN